MCYHIWQKVNGWKSFFRAFTELSNGNQKCQQSGKGHCDHNQDKGIPDRLEKIWVMKDVGIVVHTCPIVSLGSGIIALFKGIDKNIDKRVDHENTQKKHSRQKVQPAFEVSFVHRSLPLKVDPFTSIMPEQEEPFG